MLRLTWKFILARKIRTALLVLGVLIVSGAFGLLLGAVETTRVTVNSDLAQYWRSTYDILVRPKGSRSQVEKEYNLVEANYLSNISGGITMQQYQKIKNIPGVEVAAPIAMLGYSHLFVSIPMQVDCQPGFYRLDDSISTNDGLRNYSLAGVEYFYCDPKDMNFYHLFDSMSYIVNMDQYSPGYIQKNVAGISPNDVPWFKGDVYSIPILLAAIDPEQESKLVGLDKSMVQGGYLNGQGKITSWNNLTTTSFPIILNSKIYSTFILHSEWKRIDLQYSQDTLKSSKKWKWAAVTGRFAGGNDSRLGGQ